MTTQELIEELKRDEHNREVEFQVKSLRHPDFVDAFIIDRVDTIPRVVITLVEK